MAAIGLQDQTICAVLTFDQPGAGKGVSTHNRAAGQNRRVAFGQGEWSGAPRARSINHSPMALATPQLGVAKAMIAPEGRTGDMEAAHLADGQAIRAGQMETDHV